jgi:hypothetical protein
MNRPKRLFRERQRSAVASAALADLWLEGHIVEVPFHTFIEPDTDSALRRLEKLGVRVSRSKGASAIDIVRNIRASEVLKAGLESFLFIDADILFDPPDAVAILKRPEPVVAGLYAAKVLGNGQINCRFSAIEEKVKFGQWADKLYPLEAVGAGFLRIKTAVLEQMVVELELPLVRMGGVLAYPFFQPVIVEEEGELRYLGEDYAFCWRCRRIGIQPMADTSIRLGHLGGYPYGWEEAGGAYIPRFKNLECDFQSPRPIEI